MVDTLNITHGPVDPTDWIEPHNHTAGFIDELGHRGICKVTGTAPSPTQVGLMWLDTSASGGIAGVVALTTVTTTYTILTSDTVILCNGTFTVTLPAASTATNGKVYYIKNIGTGVITIDGNGSETIDGALTQVLVTQYDSSMLVTNGTNWFNL